MNAPAHPAHWIPEAALRPMPEAMTSAMQARFGAQYSSAMAVREQHGRDESAFTLPPPSAVVFAESTQDVAVAVAFGAVRLPSHALWPLFLAT